MAEPGSVDRAALIADLLMGAAYADERLDGREAQTIRASLASLLGVPRLPEAYEERLRRFDPAKHDVAATVAQLAIGDKGEARRLLELIAAVNRADEVLDIAEDEYLGRVARALGVPEEAYCDLCLEVLSVETLRESFSDLVSKRPPPVPKK